MAIVASNLGDLLSHDWFYWRRRYDAEQSWSAPLKTGDPDRQNDQKPGTLLLDNGEFLATWFWNFRPVHMNLMICPKNEWFLAPDHQKQKCWFTCSIFVIVIQLEELINCTIIVNKVMWLEAALLFVCYKTNYLLLGKDMINFRNSKSKSKSKSFLV
jgi:hypothetical protein